MASKTVRKTQKIVWKIWTLAPKTQKTLTKSPKSRVMSKRWDEMRWCTFRCGSRRFILILEVVLCYLKDSREMWVDRWVSGLVGKNPIIMQLSKLWLFCRFQKCDHRTYLEKVYWCRKYAHFPDSDKVIVTQIWKMCPFDRFWKVYTFTDLEWVLIWQIVKVWPPCKFGQCVHVTGLEYASAWQIWKIWSLYEFENCLHFIGTDIGMRSFRKFRKCVSFTYLEN